MPRDWSPSVSSWCAQHAGVPTQSSGVLSVTVESLSSATLSGELYVCDLGGSVFHIVVTAA